MLLNKAMDNRFRHWTPLCMGSRGKYRETRTKKPEDADAGKRGVGEQDEKKEQ